MCKGLKIRQLLLILSLFFGSKFAYAEDVLFLDPFLDMRAYQGEVEVYTKDYVTFYVSSESLKEVLEVTFEVENDLISGWFFYQTNLISGQLNASKINIGQQRKPLEPQDLIEFEGTWFIESSALKRWFDVDVSIQVNRLLVNFNTEGRHPFFEKMKRKARYRQIEVIKNQQQQTQTHANDYSGFTWPTTDLRVSREMIDSHTMNISGTTVFDAAQHQFNVLSNVNGNSSVTRIKVQHEGLVTGRAFNYELGDIYFPAVKFLNANFSGRGIAVHGNPLSKAFAKSFLIEGQPGWELELYRENRLIDFSALDERGQYTFEGVDVNTGFNDYKVLLYGPNGEIEEQQFHFNVNDQGLLKGKWQPEFYFIEPEVPTIGSQSSTVAPLFTKVAVGHLNYGLSEGINVGLGGIVDLSKKDQDTAFAELLFVDKTHQLDIGLAAPKLDNQLSYAVDYSGNTDWGRVRFSQYKSYEFEQDRFQTGSLLGWHKSYNSVDMGLTFSQQAVAQQRTKSIEAVLGWQFEQNNISTRVNYENPEQYNGSVIARMMIANQLLQFRASYNRSIAGISEGKNVAKIDQKVNFSWRKNFSGHNLSLSSDFNVQTNKFSFNSNYSTDFDGFKFGTQIGRNTDNQWSLTFSVSTAFAWNAPLQSLSNRNYSNSARIKARTYWDKNNNQRFDGQDEPLAGVKYRGASRWRDIKSDQNGQTVLYGLNSYIPQYLAVDASELDNPFMAPLVEQFKITSHPGGEVTIDVPFYENFEIEGDIKVLKNDAPLKGQPSAVINLIKNGEVVKQILSEYDGYFLFEDIIPGKYQVEVDQKYLDKKALHLQNNETINVDLKTENGLTVVLDPVILTATPTISEPQNESKP
jgi:hypothetical protein